MVDLSESGIAKIPHGQKLFDAMWERDEPLRVRVVRHYYMRSVKFPMREEKETAAFELIPAGKTDILSAVWDCETDTIEIKAA